MLMAWGVEEGRLWPPQQLSKARAAVTDREFFAAGGAGKRRLGMERVDGNKEGNEERWLGAGSGRSLVVGAVGAAQRRSPPPPPDAGAAPSRPPATAPP
eukprot:scaffold10776_cov39-Isochrysis_galbana.AAC.1